MRKNRLFILGIFTVMVALVSLSLVSGTWAKYTSTVSGEDLARVAKWDVKFNGVSATGADNETSPQVVTFDLFNTVKDTLGGNEADVKVGSSETIIAPGTTGSFAINLSNASEVTAQYAISYTAVKNNIPVQFSLDGTNWKDDITELNVSASDSTKVAIGEAADTITVHWRWAFEGTTTDAHAGQTDGSDTTLGLTGTATCNVTVKVVWTQVD